MNVNKYGLKERARALPHHFVRARIRGSSAWKNVVVAANFTYQMESAHRCTGLLFITVRISHLAMERSVARSRRIGTSLVNTKTVLFHHRTASIFYISVFKAVQPFTFKVITTTMRLYMSIPWSVTFLICRTWAWAPSLDIELALRKYIAALRLCFLTGWLSGIFGSRTSRRYLLLCFILIRDAWTIRLSKKSLWGESFLQDFLTEENFKIHLSTCPMQRSRRDSRKINSSSIKHYIKNRKLFIPPCL